MDLTSNQINDVSILELSGSFDIYTATPVREWMEQATAAAPARIVVDFSGVGFIDSTALATLVQGIKRARLNQGDIRLSGLNQPVRMVFELTRLDKVFEIYVNKEAAVQAFEQD
jgi:anti-sigma B factor antagonist